MRVYQHVKALPPAGIGYLLPKQICTTALALLTVVAYATSVSAQSEPHKADSISASVTLSSAQSAKAHSADAKKKKKLAPKPDPNPSAAAKPASSSASANSTATQAQSPLTPLWSLINENYTNGGVGPLHLTQNIFIVEPIIPLKLTPDWNLITRWNTPITYMPRLAEPLFVPPMGASPGINFPGIGPEFGLSNMQPQFFFTPAHPGSFTFAVGPALWLPTATDKTLGINKTGGGPVFVALTTQGPLLAGFLAQNLWAGTHGTSVTGERVNTLLIEPFVFYNLPEGWFLTYRPLITADWTIDEHNRWTVPLGGGFGRIIPVGDMVLDFQVQGFYNGITAPAPGITGVGNWTVLGVAHFMFP
ncbi:MAG: hypothetical protein WB677_07550, partial [Xanthobacteraceae bacterium]